MSVVGGPEAPVVPPAGGGDNSVIQQMRAQLDLSAKEAKEAKERAEVAEKKLQEQERAKLEETDRLKLEAKDAEAKIAELTGKASQVDSITAQLEELYNEELKTAPADKQDVLKQVSSHGNWSERLKSLKAAKSLTTTAAPVTTVVGTNTNPAAPAPTPGAPGTPGATAPAKWDPKQGPPPSYGEILTKPTAKPVT